MQSMNQLLKAVLKGNILYFYEVLSKKRKKRYFLRPLTGFTLPSWPENILANILCP